MGRLRGDVQADGSKCCFVLKQSGLRQMGEPATFSGSHRCTSDVRLWLGARSVLVAPARPATSLRFSCTLASSTLTLAKIMFLIFLNLDDVP